MFLVYGTYRPRVAQGVCKPYFLIDRFLIKKSMPVFILQLILSLKKHCSPIAIKIKIGMSRVNFHGYLNSAIVYIKHLLYTQKLIPAMYPSSISTQEPTRLNLSFIVTRPHFYFPTKISASILIIWINLLDKIQNGTKYRKNKIMKNTSHWDCYESVIQTTGYKTHHYTCSIIYYTTPSHYIG